jgi:hypothetical protein
VASIIERIDLGCVRNLMLVLISLTEPVILTNLWIQSAVNSSATYCYRGSPTSAAGDEV